MSIRQKADTTRSSTVAVSLWAQTARLQVLRFYACKENASRIRRQYSSYGSDYGLGMIAVGLPFSVDEEAMHVHSWSVLCRHARTQNVEQYIS